MLVLRNLYNFYNHHFNENLDPRIGKLFLSDSPWIILLILAAYLYFVNGAGQRWMENRKPFKLTKLIRVYNIIQVVANLYIFCMACYHPQRQENFKLFCIPIPKNDFSDTGNKIIHISHLYVLTKVVDLMDTVFFVLRKKNNQVTFLHIYHHAGMVVCCYTYFKIYSGGSYATVLGLLNSFVHCAMYSYYFISSYKPELKKSLWWKKYITQIQLIQFVILFCYCTVSICFVDCPNPKIFLWFGMVQSVIMMTMFSDFYYKAYIKKKALP